MPAQQSHPLDSGTPSGGSYCDGGTVYSSGANIWSWQHTNADCAGFVSDGQGLVGKLKVAGKGEGAGMSDTFFGADYGIFSEYVGFVLPKKLKNGGTWEVWLGLGGTTSFLANEGPLINVANGAFHKPAHATKGASTKKALQALIQLHKKA